ncbi:MAG: hypothetical protein HC922_11545 [Leptolyngbyaceae cyanobacterium SM2_3_12]|nr:hypothetical protein [Leptolyngbyaceae cyanobacterium SM2_3_12]
MDAVLDPADQGDIRVPGYFVMSSAPPNIEEAQEDSDDVRQRSAQGIEEIADHLHRMVTTSPSQTAELIITVHGYNTSRSGVEAWYKNIFKYINRHDEQIACGGNRVFIGYRWPSENVALSDLGKVWQAFRALPPLPRDFLLTGAFCALLLFGFELFAINESIWGLLLSLVLVVVMVLGLLMLALVVLRLVVYFRDLYRADNFGVLDLVELLRQVDQAMVARTAAEMYPNLAIQPTENLQQARRYWQQPSRNKIKLSFIGHSMGALWSPT